MTTAFPEQHPPRGTLAILRVFRPHRSPEAPRLSRICLRMYRNNMHLRARRTAAGLDAPPVLCYKKSNMRNDENARGAREARTAGRALEFRLLRDARLLIM